MDGVWLACKTEVEGGTEGKWTKLKFKFELKKDHGRSVGEKAEEKMM